MKATEIRQSESFGADGIVAFVDFGFIGINDLFHESPLLFAIFYLLFFSSLVQ